MEHKEMAERKQFGLVLQQLTTLRARYCCSCSERCIGRYYIYKYNDGDQYVCHDCYDNCDEPDCVIVKQRIRCLKLMAQIVPGISSSFDNYRGFCCGWTERDMRSLLRRTDTRPCPICVIS